MRKLLRDLTDQIRCDLAKTRDQENPIASPIINSLLLYLISYYDLDKNSKGLLINVLRTSFTSSDSLVSLFNTIIEILCNPTELAISSLSLHFECSFHPECRNFVSNFSIGNFM